MIKLDLFQGHKDDSTFTNQSLLCTTLGFPGGSVIKNLPASAGDTGDMGSIPGSGRCPGRRNGNPLQYSCLENPMDRGTWAGYSTGFAKRQH